MSARLQLIVLGVVLVVLPACSARLPHRVTDCDSQVAAYAAESEIATRQMVRDLFRSGVHACEADSTFVLAYNAAVYNTLELTPAVFLQEFGRTTNQQFVLTQLQRPLTLEADPERALRVLSISGVRANRDYGRVASALRIAHLKSPSSR